MQAVTCNWCKSSCDKQPGVAANMIWVCIGSPRSAPVRVRLVAMPTSPETGEGQPGGGSTASAPVLSAKGLMQARLSGSGAQVIGSMAGSGSRGGSASSANAWTPDSMVAMLSKLPDCPSIIRTLAFSLPRPPSHASTAGVLNASFADWTAAPEYTPYNFSVGGSESRPHSAGLPKSGPFNQHPFLLANTPQPTLPEDQTLNLPADQSTSGMAAAGVAGPGPGPAQQAQQLAWPLLSDHTTPQLQLLQAQQMQAIQGQQAQQPQPGLAVQLFHYLEHTKPRPNSGNRPVSSAAGYHTAESSKSALDNYVLLALEYRPGDVGLSELLEAGSLHQWLREQGVAQQGLGQDPSATSPDAMLFQVLCSVVAAVSALHGAGIPHGALHAGHITLSPAEGVVRPVSTLNSAQHTAQGQGQGQAQAAAQPSHPLARLQCVGAPFTQPPVLLQTWQRGAKAAGEGLVVGWGAAKIK